MTSKFHEEGKIEDILSTSDDMCVIADCKTHMAKSIEEIEDLGYIQN